METLGAAGLPISYWCQGIFITCTKNGLNDVFLNGVQSLSINGEVESFNQLSVGQSQNTLNHIKPNIDLSIKKIMSNIDYVLMSPSSIPTNYSEGYLLKKENLGFSVSEDAATSLKDFNLKVVYGDPLNKYLSGAALEIYTYYKFLLSSISYNLSVDEPFSETYNFTGSICNKSAGTSIPTNSLPYYLGGSMESNLEILNRDNYSTSLSIIPADITNLTSVYKKKDGIKVYGIQSINVDVGINYNKFTDIGARRGANNQDQVNYWTSVSLPLDITTSFKIIVPRVLQRSILDINTNFVDRRILLVIQTLDENDRSNKYRVIDLGNKNKIDSISLDDGDVEGGFITATLNYKNVNNDFSTYYTSSSDFDDLQQTTEIF